MKKHVLMAISFLLFAIQLQAQDVWTQRSSGVTTTFREVIYGGGRFVAVGIGGVIKRSTDGITWTDRTTAIPATTNFQSVAYGNSTYVAVGTTNTIFHLQMQILGRLEPQIY